jgi:hypothetical protein
MPNDPIPGLVAREIEGLHKFLEDWLNGTAPATDEAFAEGLADRLHLSFVNIQPAGLVLERGDLLEQIRSGHGKSPDFRIRVRNVELRHRCPDAGTILATYEEYQKGARNSARACNARLSSALFERTADGRLVWLHVHETWLPEAKHDPAGFRF